MEPAKLGMVGLPPVVSISPGNPEAQKYSRLWEFPEYREIAPGEMMAEAFLGQARPRKGATAIDFGCGTGRGALMLALLGGMKVTMIDFVNNCLDLEVRDALTTQAHALRFIKADLEKPIPIVASYGYCCDVMEHIPPDRVNLVLNNILQSAQHCFFAIMTCPDNCGQMIGEELHLTQQPYEWWLEQFRRRDCVIHWSMKFENHCMFYVSAWQDGQTIVDSGILNVTDEKIKENVRFNCAQGWEQVSPHETNDLEVVLVGGGPSLSSFEDEIKTNRWDGMKLVTLNGTYNWCLDRELVPSAQIMVDARPFNARFTKPVVDDCRYLLASQCDPEVFKDLPKDRTYIWHTGAELIGDIVKEHYPTWWPIPGGSTVLLRAIPLMRMLGYRKFHLYGCDSCLTDNGHHAYAQPENDAEYVLPVIVSPSGRSFKCHPWMLAQAQEMISLIKFMGDEIELDIRGDGLLSHILEAGAEVTLEKGN